MSKKFSLGRLNLHRKMMKGYIRRKYGSNNKQRIATALLGAAPQYHQPCQTNTTILTNPMTIMNTLAINKLYNDQNKKLAI